MANHIERLRRLQEQQEAQRVLWDVSPPASRLEQSENKQNNNGVSLEQENLQENRGELFGDLRGVFDEFGIKRVRRQLLQNLLNIP